MTSGITSFTLVAGIISASIIVIPFLVLFFQRDSSKDASDSADDPERRDDPKD